MKRNTTNYLYSGHTFYDTDRSITNCLPFYPVQHGFHFPNDFVFKPTLGGITLGSWKAGLCGGMCAGALYRYNNHVVVPSETNPPAFGSILYKEIYNRQRKSLSFSLVFKILHWQSSPDLPTWNYKYSIGYRTKKEWLHLKNLLDAGRPAIIILIQVKGYFQNLTKNHQVLAIGYNYYSKNGILIIHAYDPNIPNKVNHLTFNLDLHRTKLNAYDSYRDRLRGFFVNPLTDDAAA